MHSKQIISLTVCIAAALFVGATTLMPADVYSSAWWFGFWTVVGVGLLVTIVRCCLWKRPTAFLLHLSFILILAGGGATALTAKRGMLHLAPGESSSEYVTDDGKVEALPERVTLKSFTTEYYPGMNFPRDFRSVLTLDNGEEVEISVNRIGRIDGYRFYQSSFDGNGGTILSVYHDPVGISLTYAGYLLFAIAGALLLVRRFRKTSAAAFLLLAIMVPTRANASIPAVSPELADSLSLRPVIFNGRIVPFETFARELTLKLTGSRDAGGLSASRFTASLLVYSESWREVPFIRIKDSKLAKALGLNGKYVSPAALYTADGHYLPADIYKGGEGALDKEILQLDEKVALLGQLWSGTLFTPLPAGDKDMPSRTALMMQVWFGRIDAPILLFIIIFVCAVAVACGASRRIFSLIAAAAGICVFVWQWLILEHIPLADSPQILRFTAIGIIVTGACIPGRDRLLSSLSLLMAGCLALVSWMGTRTPAMTPLMPVLSSPWLAIHVSLVMTSYAILGFTLPVSVTALLIPERRRELAQLSHRLLLPGSYILGLGIFTGAMWANVSWGRYWAWDPKETWALVTMLLYAIPLHRSLGLDRRPKLLHIYLICASLSIVMTYAGVNLLNSLHAYA